MFRKSRAPRGPVSCSRRHLRRNNAARLRAEPLEHRLLLATLLPGFSESLVTAGLASPTAMQFSPLGELWVLERAGDVRLVRANGTTHEAIDLDVETGGSEQGLLGIAFAPNYDGVGVDHVYLYYTEPAGPGGDRANNRLSRFTVIGAGSDTPALADELVLRDLPPNTEDNDTNHNGGAIHFGPDGKLYVAVGDHNYDGQTQANHVAQNLDTPFGKILRLNADGTNPTDNPFYDGALPNASTNWQGSIWALGLRNPYTFAFDPESGAMFINDVGESNWEEINRGEAGANYGWASFSPLWEGFEVPPPSWANYRDPVMAYDHSNSPPTPAGVAITGGAFYPSNGPFGSQYAGLYFFADYQGNFIRTFDPDNPGTPATPDTSSAFASGASNPVDLKVGPDGHLYYLARGGGGGVFRIVFTGQYGPAQVESRLLFYNQSAFDGNDAAANFADDDAIATDKTAYRPGDGLIAATSVSSFTRGINGIMVDVSGNHGPLSVDDFTFRTSGTFLAANNAAGSWIDAPDPLEVIVRAGAGANGSDRVTITWASGAIVNRYVQVTVEGNDAAGGFNANTGLATSDVFYFGSKPGDTFVDTSAQLFVASATDELQTRQNAGPGAAITDPYDFDRNGFAGTASDQFAIREHFGLLWRIQPGVAPSAPRAADLSGIATALAVSALSRERGEAAAGPRLSRGAVPPRPASNDRPPRAEATVAPYAPGETAVPAEEEHQDPGPLSGDAWLDDELLNALLAGRRAR